MKKSVTITITGTAHGELQGWAEPAGGPERTFQSVLELLRLLQRAAEAKA